MTTLASLERRVIILERRQDHTDTLAALHALNAKIDALTVNLQQRDALMAVTLDDILNKQTTALQKATDALTLDAAIKVVLDHQTQQITDLQAQLDAAIATGDMTKVQAISDNMDAILQAQDTDAAAKAILAGTPPGTGNL